eukprot:jgi/Phyca11/505743/fgenesh2_kg.PHYCAscaffold_15_\
MALWTDLLAFIGGNVWFWHYKNQSRSFWMSFYLFLQPKFLQHIEYPRRIDGMAL